MRNKNIILDRNFIDHYKLMIIRKIEKQKEL